MSSCKVVNFRANQLTISLRGTVQLCYRDNTKNIKEYTHDIALKFGGSSEAIEAWYAPSEFGGDICPDDGNLESDDERFGNGDGLRWTLERLHSKRSNARYMLLSVSTEHNSKSLLANLSEGNDPVSTWWPVRFRATGSEQDIALLKSRAEWYVQLYSEQSQESSAWKANKTTVEKGLGGPRPSRKSQATSADDEHGGTRAIHGQSGSLEGRGDSTQASKMDLGAASVIERSRATSSGDMTGEV
jgi:hypothetical protein